MLSTLQNLLPTVCLVLLAMLTAGSLLNLSTRPHWFIRGWDFPRIQIVAACVMITAAYVVARGSGSSWSWEDSGAVNLIDATVLGLTVFICLWHGYRILPYTPLWPKQTQRTSIIDTTRSIRVVISNVQMCNDKYGQWIATIAREKPDVVIALEINQQWLDQIKAWRELYPYEVAHPQDNCYGLLMVSRLPIVDSKIRFLVHDDIPSIDATLNLRSEEEIRVIAIHPRPPEPVRDTHSGPRDAELMLYGKELADLHQPVIVGGDLNDVAWSRTTRLFLRVSDLLDPRRGRKLLNSFHAQYWYLRFPLDHVFHSEHFTLRDLRRLPEVGSDHFPILIDLQLNRGKMSEQDSLEANESDEELASDLIDRQVVAGSVDA